MDLTDWFRDQILSGDERLKQLSKKDITKSYKECDLILEIGLHEYSTKETEVKIFYANSDNVAITSMKKVYLRKGELVTLKGILINITAD